jgi:hypothetical protein
MLSAFCHPSNLRESQAAARTRSANGLSHRFKLAHNDPMIIAKAMTSATLATTRRTVRKVSRFSWVFRFRGSGRFVGIQTRHHWVTPSQVKSWHEHSRPRPLRDQLAKKLQIGFAVRGPRNLHSNRAPTRRRDLPDPKYKSNASSVAASTPAPRPPVIEAVRICVIDYGTYPLAQNDTSPDDAALFELIEQYLIANAKYVRLGEIASQMVNDHWKGHPKPEALRIRAADLVQGLPQPASPKATFYNLSYDVDALRKPNWDATTGFVALTSEARARADEIVQAFEEWWSGAIASKKYRSIRGLHAAECRMDMAGRLARHLQDKVIRTPARTLDGRIAKARCLAADLIDGESPEDKDRKFESPSAS